METASPPDVKGMTVSLQNHVLFNSCLMEHLIGHGSDFKVAEMKLVCAVAVDKIALLHSDFQEYIS